MIDMDAANAIESAIDAKIAKAASKETRTTGKVTRIDSDGTVFVMLQGSDIETPVKHAAAAVEPDEEVTVTISGGSMSIDGNYSRPATDDRAAKAAQLTADAAVQNAAIAADAAATAVANAEIAQEAAISAQNSLKSVVQGATTVEKAVSVMQTALEAVVDYDPDTDTTTEYFWHDANGAHVLGDEYRNDINSTGMDIVEVATERSAAHFGTDGARIGKAYDAQALDNENHLEIDSNSMRLVNEDNEAYFHAGDARGEKQYIDIPDDGWHDDRSSNRAAYMLDGVCWYEDTLTASSGGNEGFPLYPPIDASLQIGMTAKLNGDDLSSGDYTVSPRIITIGGVDYAVDMVRVTGESVAVGDVLSFTWPVSSADFPMYMTFGSRVGGIGYGSSVMGENCRASGRFSHAEGSMLGYDEAGWDDRGPIASGMGSHAEGIATIASAVGAHSEGSVAKWRPSGSVSSAFKPVTASGDASHAEGAGTEASGYAAHAQNKGTIAAYDSQTAIGAWNDNQSGNAFEIGNGTDDDNRSNALAVDWSGNLLIDGDVQDLSGTNLYTKTRVKGNAESSYRTGDVNLTPANIGAAASSHNHGAGDINSGTLALARGGTGASLSAAPSIITNLASTAGASPFAASPRPGVTGILPRANGGTGINNAGNWSGSAAGTDVVAGAASTWYTAHSLSIPAGRGILIANISLSSGTGGTIYARLTSRTLAQTKTDDPNYQTTEDGIWFCRAESNVLCNGHIVMFYNHSVATTYYLHWKSLSTSSALRFGRIAYMQIAAN